MKRINEFFDNLFNLVPGYIFGLLSVIIGLTGDILALLFSPEYVMYQKSISILGQHSGGMFLRGGLIFSSLFSIPFIIFLGRALKDETVNENLRKLAIITGIFSSVSAILTGTFSGVNPFISSLHGLFALFSWMGGAIFCLLFSFVMLKNPKFSELASNVSLVIGEIFACYLIPFFITNFCNYYADVCYGFGRIVYLILPSFEWVIIFSILFWYLFNSCYMLHEKI